MRLQRERLQLEADDTSGARLAHGLVGVAERALEPVARDGLVLGFSGFTPAQILAGVLGLRQAIGDLAVR